MNSVNFYQLLLNKMEQTIEEQSSGQKNSNNTQETWRHYSQVLGKSTKGNEPTHSPQKPIPHQLTPPSSVPTAQFLLTRSQQSTPIEQPSNFPSFQKISLWTAVKQEIKAHPIRYTAIGTALLASAILGIYWFNKVPDIIPVLDDTQSVLNQLPAPKTTSTSTSTVLPSPTPSALIPATNILNQLPIPKAISTPVAPTPLSSLAKNTTAQILDKARSFPVNDNQLSSEVKSNPILPSVLIGGVITTLGVLWKTFVFHTSSPQEIDEEIPPSEKNEVQFAIESLEMTRPFIVNYLASSMGFAVALLFNSVRSVFYIGLSILSLFTVFTANGRSLLRENMSNAVTNLSHIPISLIGLLVPPLAKAIY